MQFRWCAAIALWTILSGPIMNRQGSVSSTSREPRQAVTPAACARPGNGDSPVRVILTSRSRERPAPLGAGRSD